MSFISASFAALYLLAMLLRLSVGRNKQSSAYLIGLGLCSLIFYGWHVPAYLVLISASILTDYVAARGIEAASAHPGKRKRWLIVSLVINLGLLGYFKYTGLLLQIAGDPAVLVGFDASLAVVEIVLPVGISFYTFQSMSYTIDVYRGKLPAERSFWRFGLYVAFFPQLVAGPIVRAGEFLYQLPRRRRIRGRVFFAGSYLMLRGFFLKVVIADNLGVVVDDHWEAATASSAPPLLAFSLLGFYSCQLFCDFAGYSDIARGLAYQLGFRLPVNFRAPFIAMSFREFWQRWHITLSQWMRDYVYIVLGGNRGGRARSLLNLVLVMWVSGLWHGANLTFVLWGALHGVAAALERLLGIGMRGVSAGSASGLEGGARSTRWGPLARLGGVLWFVGVQLVWILSMGIFRAENLSEAGAILSNALSSVMLLSGGDAGVGAAAAVAAAGVDVDLAALFSDGWAAIVTGWLLTLPVWLLHLRTLASEKFGVAESGVIERSVVAGIMAYGIATLYASTRGFIYFQF